MSRAPVAQPPVAPVPGEEEARRAAARRRRVYRRRRTVAVISLLVVAAIAIGAGVYVSNALNAPVPAAAQTVVDPPPIVQPAQAITTPGFGTWAVSAVGFPGPLAQSADQSPMPTASLTKVITSLVILDKYPVAAGEPGPDIAYTDDDVDIYWDMIAQNGSVSPVVAGATLSLRESLEAMLLPSGNNYAISLSNWAFGSEQGLVDAARAWLDARGLVNTRIADASGLSLDNTSIPTELLQIAQLALEQPVLAEVVATQQVDIPELGVIRNTNKMLGTHGVDGIKTGTTDDAANLMFSADYPVGSTSITVVGVVLGGENHQVLDDAIGAMLDTVAPGFHEVVALTAGQELATYAQPWGDDAIARARDGASVIVWSDTPVDVEVQADSLTLAADGSEVGTATVHAGDQVITVPLVLDGTIDDPGDWWRLTNPGGLDPDQASAGPATRPVPSVRPAPSSVSAPAA